MEKLRLSGPANREKWICFAHLIPLEKVAKVRGNRISLASMITEISIKNIENGTPRTGYPVYCNNNDDKGWPKKRSRVRLLPEQFTPVQEVVVCPVSFSPSMTFLAKKN
ncbi:hypothetical protein NQ317_015922 [Molorchus minor]|uniref:Uncharacterized protein n=1 Tax=Molorchus minor TaxID=1323400 RepID=A0ABQ9JL43_9CUCU|nr:hypothetical protein NQ317_015922 [Molorchus minor]